MHGFRRHADANPWLHSNDTTRWIHAALPANQSLVQHITWSLPVVWYTGICQSINGICRCYLMVPVMLSYVFRDVILSVAFMYCSGETCAHLSSGFQLNTTNRSSPVIRMPDTNRDVDSSTSNRPAISILVQRWCLQLPESSSAAIITGILMISAESELVYDYDGTDAEDAMKINSIRT